ncbi:MAG: phosphopyruvate hydratase [Christensenellaceae bacterium]|jgi:enolase|nr:phosphopyruvate hydratase [Christensenellaceae bacterium]
MKILKLTASEILDSRGNPTIETYATVSNERQAVVGWCAVPSGASTGEKEAVELRDGDKARYNGKGVLKAVQNVNETILKAVLGRDFATQADLDNFLIKLDGTPNKGKLGANAILSVSLSFARAASTLSGQEFWQYIASQGGLLEPALPTPAFNIINGGVHADSGIDFQEFMIVPLMKTSFAEKLRAGSEITAKLKSILKIKNLATSVGDEGGFAPKMSSKRPIKQALDLLIEAISKAGYKAGEDVSIAIDLAASVFYDKAQKKYIVKNEEKTFTSQEFVDYLIDLTKNYPIISLEDPFDENDMTGFATLTKKIGGKVQIVGDDLFCTNKELLQNGIDCGACNSVLIKMNQIGTLTETLETISLARSAGYSIFVSHRSGETTDTAIADLAFATHAEFIKSGAPVRGERVCKYNRLMQIERGERN